MFKIIEEQDFFPPPAEIVCQVTENFHQEFATLKRVAQDLVWLILCYITAISLHAGGGERGIGANVFHSVTLPGSGGESRARGCWNTSMAKIFNVFNMFQTETDFQEYIFLWKVRMPNICTLIPL
jgi:hypothetical protein